MHVILWGPTCARTPLDEQEHADPSGDNNAGILTRDAIGLSSERGSKVRSIDGGASPSRHRPIRLLSMAPAASRGTAGVTDPVPGARSLSFSPSPRARGGRFAARC